MPKFNRKPVEVEAVKFEDTEESILAIRVMVSGVNDDDSVMVDRSDLNNPVLVVENSITGGKSFLSVGDYVVSDSDGNLYNWQKGLFELAHEEVIE